MAGRPRANDVQTLVAAGTRTRCGSADRSLRTDKTKAKVICKFVNVEIKKRGLKLGMLSHSTMLKRCDALLGGMNWTELVKHRVEARELWKQAIATRNAVLIRSLVDAVVVSITAAGHVGYLGEVQVVVPAEEGIAMLMEEEGLYDVMEEAEEITAVDAAPIGTAAEDVVRALATEAGLVDHHLDGGDASLEAGKVLVEAEGEEVFLRGGQGAVPLPLAHEQIAEQELAVLVEDLLVYLPYVPNEHIMESLL